MYIMDVIPPFLFCFTQAEFKRAFRVMDRRGSLGRQSLGMGGPDSQEDLRAKLAGMDREQDGKHR